MAQARRPVIAGALLAPGAGAGSNQGALVALDGALTLLGLIVERIDFPYHLAGRRRPDPPAVLEATIDQRARALAERAAVTTDALVLGGRSMGGRICSQVVSQALPAAGLVLVSYPLHPPGQPEKVRTAHFSSIVVPCLFVSGTRDAFGSPDELEAATHLIGAPVTHVWLDRADHSLRGRDGEVASAVTSWLTTTFTVPGQLGRS